MQSKVSTVSGDQSVEELRRELAEARDQQAATAEILKVISNSPMDPQRVFEEIATTAARLCDAHDAVIRQVDGEVFRLVAHHGPIPTTPVVPLRRGALSGRAALERRTIHVADLQAETEEYPEGSDRAGRLGFRTMLSVPLIRTGEAIGTISVRRTEVRPFTDRQIALVKTFADQAVIAIENTRLLNELRESLQQQTATADVLKIISRSTFDLQPVLEALIKNATKLCAAEQGFIFRSDGELYHLAAYYNAPAGFREWTHRRGIRPGDGTVVGRVALEDRTIQILDAQADAAWRTTNAQAPGTSGVRTLLGVPMRREGVLIGVIAMWRTEIRPFTDKQVALVETFADQAVIAIENTRLLNELRQSLQQQTATADVLKVISRSTFDLQAVLDTLVEAAARLCDADMAQILRPRVADYYVAAKYGFSSEYVEYHKAVTFAPGRGSLTGRVLLEGKPVQIPDVLADPEYNNPEPQRLGGYRTHLGVPLLRGGSQIGVILVSRRTVRPFDNKQIELVTTFADQAVIAIENTRLFEEVQAGSRELAEALEQQTVSSEVLRIISSSPRDLRPVFQAMLENAVRICDAKFGHLWLLEGDAFRTVAVHNAPRTSAIRPGSLHRPPPDMPVARAAITKQVVQLDIKATQSYMERDPFVVDAVDVAGFRTVLAVPMLKDDQLVGAITILRQEVRPFGDKQIELVKTFADQAVIAIENTRLFEEVQARSRELSRSVQELQALGDVGRAVSSTLDLKVVLKTIVDRAVNLSGTDGGSIFYYHQRAARFELGETTGLDEEVVARFRKLDISTGQTGLGEAIAQRQPLQLTDILNRPSNPLRDAAIEAGLLAALIVPLLGSEGPLGALVLQRRQPGEFPAAVVTLMQAFADQSAIALENARLFNEIAQKSHELEIASQHKSQFVANMSHEL
jgi:GAF domain-containing protein